MESESMSSTTQDISFSQGIEQLKEAACFSPGVDHVSDDGDIQAFEERPAASTGPTSCKPGMSGDVNISLEQVVVKEEVAVTEVESEMPFAISQSHSSQLVHRDCQTFGDDSVAPTALNTEVGGVTNPIDALMQSVVKPEEMVAEDEDPEMLFKLSHPQSQSSQLLYSCKYCGHKMKKELSLRKHEEAHRNGTIYKCRFCNYHTLSRAFMEGHETKHTGVKPFKCDYCDHRTRYKIDMRKHQCVHFSIRRFKCHLCPFRSKWKAGVDRHLQTHSSIRDFSCPLCSARFKRKGGLKTHMTRHSSYKPFKCDKCNYSCRIRSMLLMHIKTHSEVRNFICTHPGCSRRCKTNSDLTKHISTHSKSYDFLCKMCGKAFKTRHSLTSHLKRHAEKKMDFTCTVCEKKLSTRFGLRKHLAQHFMEKRHSCPICDHRFHSLCNMRKHMAVHGSDRSFGCPICKFYGKDVSVLLAHIGQLHGREYTYFCEECRKPFSTIQKMKQHVLRCHMGDKPKEQCEFVYDQNCCERPTFSQQGQSSNSNSVTEYTQNELLNLSDLNTCSQLATEQKWETYPATEHVCTAADETSANDETRASANPDSVATVDAIPNDCSWKVFPNSDFLGGSSLMEDVAHGTNSGKTQEDIGDSTATNKLTMPCLDPKNMNPAAPCMKSLAIKLERLPDVDGTSKAHPVRSHDLERKALSSIFKIGSVGSVGVCLAGKFSGIRLNLEKRGKKTNKWYMSSEYTANKEAGERKGRFNKKPSSDAPKRKLKSPSAVVHDDGINHKRRKVATISKPKKNSRIQHKSVDHTPSGRRRSIQQPSIVKGCDNKHRNEIDPPLVNFDVRVKCERLDPELLNKIAGACNKEYNVRSDTLVSNDLGSGKLKKNLFPAASMGARIQCDRLSPSKINGCIKVINKVTKVSNGLQSGQDDLEVVTERIESLSHKEYTASDPYLHLNSSKRKKLSGSQSADSKPQEGRAKVNKGPRKQVKMSKKGKRDQAFIEESCFVEDIMDSPFKIRWKTMRNVENSLPLHKRRMRNQPPIDTLGNDDDVPDAATDEKPMLPRPESTSQDHSIVLLSKCENNPCSVQIEDLTQMYSGSSVNTNETILVKDMEGSSRFLSKQPTSDPLPQPVQTITLEEFENEYRKKKKLVAKMDIVSEPYGYSYNCQTASRHDEITMKGDVKETQTLKELKVSFPPMPDKPYADERSSRHDSYKDSPKTADLSNQNFSSKHSGSPRVSASTQRNRADNKGCKSNSNRKGKTSKVTKRGRLNVSLFKNSAVKKQRSDDIRIKSSENVKMPVKFSPEKDYIQKNISLSAKGDMVKLWKMACECLSKQVTVDLFDYKKGRLLCLQNTCNAIDSSYIDVSDIKQSPTDTSSLVNEWCEGPKVDQLGEIETLPTGHEEDPEKCCDVEGSPTAVEESPSIVTVYPLCHEDLVESGQAPKLSPAHPIVDPQWASSDIQELKEKDVPFQLPSSTQPGDETEKWLYPACVKGNQEDKMTTTHPQTKVTSDFSRTIQEENCQTEYAVPQASAEEIDDNSNMIINASTRLFEKNTPTGGEASQTVTRDLKSRNPLSDFFHHHVKLLHKLFPSCPKSISPRILKTHLNKWKCLPLPKDFFMDEGGKIHVAGLNKRVTVDKMKNLSLSATSIGSTEASSMSSGHAETKVKQARKRLVHINNGRKKKTSGKVQDITSVKQQLVASTSKSKQTGTGKNHKQKYIKQMKVIAEVYQPFGGYFNETIDVKSDDAGSIVAEAPDNETRIITNALCSEDLQQNKLSKTSDPVLSLSEDNLVVTGSYDSNNFPLILDSSRIPSCSTNSSPPKVKECETIDQTNPTVPEVYLDNDLSSCDFGENAVENRSIRLVSGVLPPSDDICPLPDDFFSDLIPKSIPS